MKIGQFLKKMVGGSMIFAALACPMFTSCYNDAALWDEIDGIHDDVATLEQKLAALEAKLNTDLAALQTILEGQISQLEGKVDGLVTVKNVTENADGSVTVTLSDNTEFTVHPKFEQDYSGLVTTTKIDGVLYWAIYDENGKPVAVTDADGDLVPVVDVVPQVRIDKETALVEISFDGGITWMAISYNEPCVFENAEIVYTDNYTDEQEAADPDWYVETPLYVVLSLPDGNTITLSLDGAGSVVFGSHSYGLMTSLWIPSGSQGTVTAMTQYIDSWVKEVPTGWKVVENTDVFEESGMIDFLVTAPSAEAIASGLAVPTGELKLMALTTGGKALSAKVLLSVEGFNSLSTSKDCMTIDVRSGVYCYVYDIVPVDQYDEELILEEVKNVIETNSSWEYRSELNVAYRPIINDKISNYAELEYGEDYVLYAICISENFDQETYDYTYTVGSISSTEFTYSHISFDETATEITFSDIDIEVEFKGMDSFYAGFARMYDESDLEQLVDEINMTLNYMSWGMCPVSEFYVNDESVDGWDNAIYTGSAAVFGQEQIEPGSKYYLILMPAGKEEYTTSDVYYYEFETPAPVPGGSINLVETAFEASLTQIEVTLEAEGAWGIYYAYIEPEKISTIDKVDYLLEQGFRSFGPTLESNHVMEINSSVVMIAIAIDDKGAYGDVYEKTYSSETLTYNDVEFKLSVVGEITEKATVKVEVSGGTPTEYYSWTGTSSYYWDNDYDLATGSCISASNYFVSKYGSSLYPFKKLTLPEDGLVEVTGLQIGKPKYFIITSVTKDGENVTFSEARVIKIERSFDYGTIVYSKDDNGNENATWAAAKPEVNLNSYVVGDSANLDWTVSDLPEGWTGYTMLVDSEYVSSYTLDKDLLDFLMLDDMNLISATYDIENGETYSAFWLYEATYYVYVILVDPDGNYYAPYKWSIDIDGTFGV